MCDIGKELYNFQVDYCNNLLLLLRRESVIGTQVGKAPSTVDEILQNNYSGVWKFSKNNVYDGYILIDFTNMKFSIICKVDKPKIDKPKIVKSKELDIDGLLERVYKKFKLTTMEKDILSNYVDYMNEESREPFLEKVYGGDRKYLDKFLDTDLEQVGEEVFETKIDYNDKSRRQQKDMYNLLQEDQSSNRLLLYKGLIKKLSTLNRETRHDIYIENLLVDEITREKVYDAFINYIKRLDQPTLEKFIDDVFDRNIPGDLIFNL